MTAPSSQNLSAFVEAVADRRTVVGVIGLGYVGIPLAQSLVKAGFRVIGFDILPERIAQLSRHESPIGHISNAEIVAMHAGGFEATTDFVQSSTCDALIICVPTPLDEHREPDLSFVQGTMESLTPHLRKGQLLSLESTTWPGTTREVLALYIEALDHTIGDDFFLVYSPERENPGDEIHQTVSIPKIVGGHTSACLKAGVALYEAFIKSVVPVSSTKAAEMVKLVENIHRSVNIGLVNELKITCDRMDLDIFEIIGAAATKPFGFTPYYPGPGVGGHCIPIDPFYLAWKAREYGVDTHFIQLAGEVNEAMPDFVVGKVIRALNERGKAMKGAKILALGIAYKPNVDDPRESPSIAVIERMKSWDAEVDYTDPHIPAFPKMRKYDFDLVSVPLNAETLAQYDAVVMLTNHAAFDIQLITEHAKLIIDTRGVWGRDHPKVVSA